MVYVNDKVVYEHDRNISFEEEQLAFFDKMDADMERGIKIQGESIKHPDSQQCKTFVVMNLIVALQHENNAITSASSGYLINRHPSLTEAHIIEHKKRIKVEFVEE